MVGPLNRDDYKKRALRITHGQGAMKTDRDVTPPCLEKINCENDLSIQIFISDTSKCYVPHSGRDRCLYRVEDSIDV